MGHLIALLTVLIWGTTFISTKILLKDFSPVEILLIRFVLGFLVLTAIYPRWLPFKEKRQEILFMLAGLCGICLYYLLENIALVYTQASNVGVIISAAPFFTAIAARFIIGALFRAVELGGKTARCGEVERVYLSYAGNNGGYSVYRAG